MNLRRQRNFNLFLRDFFQNDTKKFKKEFIANMLKIRKTKEFAELKVKQILSAKTGHRGFSDEMEELVEKAFNLKKDVLSQPSKIKKPVYILVNVRSNKAIMEGFKRLQICRIVDEISLIRGNAEIFIRAYGTDDEIDNFLLNDMEKYIKGGHSTTYTAFKSKTYQRHPIKTHPDRKTNLEKWLA